MRTITLKDENVIQIHDQGEALSDHIAREENYFEIEILDWLEENHGLHTIILDVGANIGNHTLFFGTHFSYSAILAFEPVPANFELLVKNTLGLPGVKIYQVAVGDGDLDIKMKLNPGNMGACEVQPSGDITVQQITLDDLDLPIRVSLIKLDVEWYEPFVLLGAKELIEKDKPLILIEDSKEEYSSLLPEDYHLIKAWPEHRTYLYGT